MAFTNIVVDVVLTKWLARTVIHCGLCFRGKGDNSGDSSLLDRATILGDPFTGLLPFNEQKNSSTIVRDAQWILYYRKHIELQSLSKTQHHLEAITRYIVAFIEIWGLNFPIVGCKTVTTKTLIYSYVVWWSVDDFAWRHRRYEQIQINFSQNPNLTAIIYKFWLFKVSIVTFYIIRVLFYVVR